MFFNGGTENGTSGAQIKILRPLFNTNTPPQNPYFNTLGTILDPEKVIFGHFIFFCHFPIEIRIEAENFLPPWEGVEVQRKQNMF